MSNYYVVGVSGDLSLFFRKIKNKSAQEVSLKCPLKNQCRNLSKKETTFCPECGLFLNTSLASEHGLRYKHKSRYSIFIEYEDRPKDILNSKYVHPGPRDDQYILGIKIVGAESYIENAPDERGRYDAGKDHFPLCNLINASNELMHMFGIEKEKMNLYRIRKKNHG